MKVLVELETEDIATIRERLNFEIDRFNVIKAKTEDELVKTAVDDGIVKLNAILAKLTF